MITESQKILLDILKAKLRCLGLYPKLKVMGETKITDKWLNDELTDINNKIDRIDNQIKNRNN